MTDDSSSEESEYPDFSDIVINDKDKEFLWCIYDEGGKVKTQTIGEKTGLSSGDRKYRFNKFEENGIINKGKEDPEEAKYHNPQNVGELTERGKQFINKGYLGGETFDEERKKTVELTLEEYEELVEDIEQLENRLKVTQKKVEDMDTGKQGDVPEEKLRETLLDMDISPDEEGKTPSSFELKTRIEGLENVTSDLMDEIEKIQEETVTVGDLKQEVNDQVNVKLGENDHPAAVDNPSTNSTSKSNTEYSDDKLTELNQRVEELEKDVNYFYDWIQKTETFLLALKLFFKDRDVDLSSYIEKAEQKRSN